MYSNPLDAGSKLTKQDIHTKVICTFTICRVSTGNRPSKYIETNRILPKKECI